MPRRLRFDGPDLTAVLDRVKSDAGPGARVISAEKVRTGGLIKKEHYEVIVELPDPVSTGSMDILADALGGLANTRDGGTRDGGGRQREQAPHNVAAHGAAPVDALLELAEAEPSRGRVHMIPGVNERGLRDELRGRTPSGADHPEFADLLADLRAAAGDDPDGIIVDGDEMTRRAPRRPVKIMAAGDPMVGSSPARSSSPRRDNAPSRAHAPVPAMAGAAMAGAPIKGGVMRGGAAQAAAMRAPEPDHDDEYDVESVREPAPQPEAAAQRRRPDPGLLTERVRPHSFPRVDRETGQPIAPVSHKTNDEVLMLDPRGGSEWQPEERTAAALRAARAAALASAGLSSNGIDADAGEVGLRTGAMLAAAAPAMAPGMAPGMARTNGAASQPTERPRASQSVRELLANPDNRRTRPTGRHQDTDSLHLLGLPEQVMAAGMAESDPALRAARMAAAIPSGFVPSQLEAGTTVAVAGPREAALRVATSLAEHLGEDPDEVVLATNGHVPAIVADRCLEGWSAAGRFRTEVARAGAVAIVVVDTGADARSLSWGRRVLEALEPAMLWAVVDAGRKSHDVGMWLEELDSMERVAVDGLAVEGVGSTSDPGSVLELGPAVCWLDGAPATSLEWAGLLLRRGTARAGSRGRS